MDKKVLIGGMLLFLTFLTGCGSRTAVFDPDGEIHMVSREEGSGTRTAFTELFGAVTVDPDCLLYTSIMSKGILSRFACLPTNPLKRRNISYE